MKTNKAKNPKLKELFFPERGEIDEGELPARVARFTSVFWVAHIFCSESNKHWKGVNSAVRHNKPMPAPFFWSQVEKNALKEAKDAKLEAARAKHLHDTKDARQTKRDEKDAAARRKKVERAKVWFDITGCNCVRGRMSWMFHITGCVV